MTYNHSVNVQLSYSQFNKIKYALKHLADLTLR